MKGDFRMQYYAHDKTFPIQSVYHNMCSSFVLISAIPMWYIHLGLACTLINDQVVGVAFLSNKCFEKCFTRTSVLGTIAETFVIDIPLVESAVRLWVSLLQ